MVRPGTLEYFSFLLLDAEFRVSAVVSQRNHGLADVAFLSVTVEMKRRQTDLWV